MPLDNIEFKALVSLLEDPDTQIYQQIEDKLLSTGMEAIPFLEESWEQSFDPLQQSRIESVIHKIQFDQIKQDLSIWKLSNQDNLLDALLIINRYQYPSFDEQWVHNVLSELRRDCWYYLMYEMSPLEKVRLLNNVIFRDYGLMGNTQDYHSPQNSYIHKVLESKRGNPISLACIYSIVAQKLDIPIYGVNLPRHFVLAYMENNSKEALFYINVFNRGQVIRLHDLHAFLEQLNLPPSDEYILPCSNLEIVKRVLRNLMSSYQKLEKEEKRKEIEILLKIMEGANNR